MKTTLSWTRNLAVLCCGVLLLAGAATAAVDPSLPVFSDELDVDGRMVYLAPIEVDDSLELRFGIGQLEVTAVEGFDLRTDLEVGCGKLSQARCDKYRKALRFEATRDGSVVRVGFRGLPKWKMRKLQLVGKVSYPRYVPLDLEVGIGDADVTVGAEGARVEMGIGDLTVRAGYKDVAAVSVKTNIGDANLLGHERKVGSRKKLVGAKIDWREGQGSSRIDVKLGIGDAKVVLE